MEWEGESIIVCFLTDVIAPDLTLVFNKDRYIRKLQGRRPF